MYHRGNQYSWQLYIRLRNEDGEHLPFHVILDANVSTAKLADVAVTTGKLADASVTNAKISFMMEFNIMNILLTAPLPIQNSHNGL